MVRTKVEQKIFVAALEILRSRGPLAVSVESVAAASGVAKTTIYRRYANRDEMLTAAVASIASETVIPESLSAHDAIRWVLRHATDTIENVVGRGTVAAVLVDADPAFTTLLRGLIRTSASPFRDDLRARSARGEIKRDLDIELVISMLLGAVVAELVRGRPTDDAWVEMVLALVWPALQPS